MERPYQKPLFRTGRQRDSKLREIDRQNLQAARIILQQHPGGLMEEWARRLVYVSGSTSAASGFEHVREVPPDGARRVL
jgi:hypothetical protein